MNEFQRALRDFQDYADDVGRAGYRTIDDALQRLVSTMVPSTPLGDVTKQLPAFDFDSWYNAQESTGGSMVGSAEITWPQDRGQRLAAQVELMRRLASGKIEINSFASHFMWVGNRFDENIAEFVRQLFRPFVRDFLRFAHDTPAFERGLKNRESELPRIGPMTDELLLFISHSAADAPVAKSLISLFEKALKLSARTIRCTSVDGYRLPAGVDTNEVLRTEVFDAKLFIALLTPSSLVSPYVLFELGARWGARRPLFPILASGANTSDLRSPLSGLNALSATAPDQVRQLVEDAAGALSTRMEPIATFSAEIEALVAMAGIARVAIRSQL
jgi:TIR domain